MSELKTSSFQPTVTHFTSLADPAAVGSGLTGLTTLMQAFGGLPAAVTSSHVKARMPGPAHRPVVVSRMNRRCGWLKLKRRSTVSIISRDVE